MLSETSMYGDVTVVESLEGTLLVVDFVVVVGIFVVLVVVVVVLRAI